MLNPMGCARVWTCASVPEVFAFHYSANTPGGSEMATCKECNGKGSVPCPDCKGKGKKDHGSWSTDWRECKLCSGSGRKKCGVCNGKGTI